MLDSLRAVLKPPPRPLEVPRDPDWAAVERDVRLDLPADYKSFIESYGTGSVTDFIRIYNPWSANRYLSLAARGRSDLPMLGEMLLAFPEEIPLSVFPTPGGLFPFGSTDNGELLAWETHGRLDDWPVVVLQLREPRWFRHPGGRADFLERLLKRRVRYPFFPDDLLDGNAGFTPHAGP